MTGLEIAGTALVAIGAAGLGLACWAQRREIEELRGEVRWHEKDAKDWYRRTCKVSVALQAIAAATATGKSGTARKVHRMATEALK